MTRFQTRSLALCAAMALSFAAMAGDDKAKKMDTDGDGKVSSAEHAAGAKAMFGAMDADKNGTVTAAEMDASRRAKGNAGKTKELDAAAKIAKIDTDGDGALSAAEHEAGSASKFTAMDTNNDGSVDKAEMEAGHKDMKK